MGLYNTLIQNKANCPDIMIKDHKNRMCFLLNMAVTAVVF